jgi:hypothetical protein
VAATPPPYPTCCALPALFAARVGQVVEVVEDRGRVTGPRGGGRVGCGGHGADVPEGAGLSWRPMVQEASDPRPDGRDERYRPVMPKSPRYPRLVRIPWHEEAPDDYFRMNLISQTVAMPRSPAATSFLEVGENASP